MLEHQRLQLCERVSVTAELLYGVLTAGCAALPWPSAALRRPRAGGVVSTGSIRWQEQEERSSSAPISLTGIADDDALVYMAGIPSTECGVRTLNSEASAALQLLGALQRAGASAQRERGRSTLCNLSAKVLYNSIQSLNTIAHKR